MSSFYSHPYNNRIIIITNIHTDVPEVPGDLKCVIRNISKERESVTNLPTTASAVASVYWNASDNNNAMIVGYNLSLTKLASGESTSYFSLCKSSFIRVLDDGNYRVSVSAVNLCGQQSEPSVLKFNISSTASTCTGINHIYYIVFGIVYSVVVN